MAIRAGWLQAEAPPLRPIAHPYTEALLKAAPELDPTRRSVIDAVRGELPSPLALPAGCPFHPRCPYVMDRCGIERPILRAREGHHLAACHLQGAALMQEMVAGPHNHSPKASNPAHGALMRSR
jgi:oligopeptide/dipeptide ABC transporter ATP-binding protein